MKKDLRRYRSEMTLNEFYLKSEIDYLDQWISYASKISYGMQANSDDMAWLFREVWYPTFRRNKDQNTQK